MSERMNSSEAAATISSNRGDDSSCIGSVYDVVVVGAGPAGLGAMSVLGGLHHLRLLIVDSGKELEQRDRYADVTSGVGGCGLYSDGKYSFFPAASHLWSLSNEAAFLPDAYRWLSDLLLQHGLTSAPPFPHLRPGQSVAGDCTWELKSYPSFYVPLEQRMAMSGKLWDQCKRHARLRTTMTGWSWLPEQSLFSVSLESPGAPSCIVHARYLIIAGGRYFPWRALHPIPSSLDFLRLEIGVRIQAPADNLAWQDMQARVRSLDGFSIPPSPPDSDCLQGLDPKYRLRGSDPFVEYRTFCCCRRGEVVSSLTGSTLSVSGRADGAPSGLSNIGFNVRVLRYQEELYTDFCSRTLAQTSVFTLSLQRVLAGDPDAMASLACCFGRGLATLLRDGLLLLCDRFPSLRTDTLASLIGPAIEGIGFYPQVQGLASAQNSRLLVVGDAHGRFRGLVAAMLSGACAGQQIGAALTTAFAPASTHLRDAVVSLRHE